MIQPNGIPLDTAAIVSTVLEGILYGLSILMFIGTIWALMCRRMQSDVNRRMITIACLLLLFSTVHMIIDIIRTYQSLVQYRDTFQPNGPIGFFSDVAQWCFGCRNTIYTLQTLVGDGVVIYRCYVVWQSWWIVVLPIGLWVSVAAIDRENIFAPGTTGPWIIAFLATTLLTNILSTSLLAFRIWKVGSRVTRVSPRATVLWPVLRIVLDAGVLYSISLLAALLCFVAKNRGHHVLIDMIMPTISITLYMVIIRITISKSTSQGNAQPSSTGSGALPLSRISRLNGDREYQMKRMRMEVHITQLTEMHEREEYGGGSGEPKKDEETGERDVDASGKVLGGFAV